MKFNQGGVPILVLVAVIGLISFLVIGSFASFNNQLFSKLFQKPASRAATGPVDMTSQVENLGNPFTDRPVFARNVWDMQFFNGKIFLGHGNSVENTVNIVLRYFDPATGLFGNLNPADGSLYNDTKIDQMRVMNNTLYFPSFDEQGSATPFGYSSYDGTNWVVHYTIPRSGSHVGDVYLYNGALYSASNNGIQKTTNLTLTNSAQSWTKISSSAVDGSFFEINGVLYESGTFGAFKINSDNTTTQYTMAQFAPGVPEFSGQFYKTASLGPTTLLLYSTAFQWHTPPANDYGNQYYGLYRTTGPGSSSKISFPAKVLPMDLITRPDGVYLLSANVNTLGQIVNTVYKFDANLSTYTEVFHFTAPAFARSFEEVNGDWYFGLGDSPSYNSTTGVPDYPNVSYLAGDIVRVKATSLNNPLPTSGPFETYSATLTPVAGTGSIGSGKYTFDLACNPETVGPYAGLYTVTPKTTSPDTFVTGLLGNAYNAHLHWTSSGAPMRSIISPHDPPGTTIPKEEWLSRLVSADKLSLSPALNLGERTAVRTQPATGRPGTWINIHTNACPTCQGGELQGDVKRVAGDCSAASPAPTSTVSSPVTPSPTPNPLVGDINGSKKVDILDYNLLITDYGATSGLGLRSDLNKSGKVDILDYNLLITNYGKSTP